MIDVPLHHLHFITSAAYLVVGCILFACGQSHKYRFLILRNEAERELTFKLVAIFVYACFLDHLADSAGADHATLWAAACFEAAVSAGTAFFLLYRSIQRGYQRWTQLP